MLLLMVSCLLGGKRISSSGELEKVTLSMRADCVSAVWSCCVRLLQSCGFCQNHCNPPRVTRQECEAFVWSNYGK